MHQENAPEDPKDWIDYLEHGSNWSVLGPKLWLMCITSSLFRWPSERRIQALIAQRRGVLHEELGIRVARQLLGGDR